MKRRLNNKGVALMLVLSAIVLLTTVIVEFAYDTNVNRHLASNERDRLKAYYLAKSAMNFMMLELKFDKTFRQIVESQNLGQYLGANAQLPLCQQFPLSTGLIRTVFAGGGLPGAGGEGEAEAGAADEAQAPAEGAEAEKVEEMQKDVSISQEKSAEEFLAFEGDFDGECVDEGTKINLNGFANLSQTAPEGGSVSQFDQYKNFLVKFLSQPKFDLLFEAADVKVPDVVSNIGDWIDTNSEGTKGMEGAAYDKVGAKYSVHDGKLLTLMEAYLIDGVVDEWFAPLMDLFTVYGDGKVNVCSASEDVVEGLIRRYVEATPSLPPLRLEDAEEMGRLKDAIGEACVGGASGEQLKQAVAQALDTAIGAVSGGISAAAAGTGQTGTGTGQTGTGTQSGGFASYLSTESRYFSLNLTGQVGDIMVRIKTVIDIKEQDPKKWKLLYWRIY